MALASLLSFVHAQDTDRPFRMNDVIQCTQKKQIGAAETKTGTAFQSGKVNLAGQVDKADAPHCKVKYCQTPDTPETALLPVDLNAGIFRDDKFYVHDVGDHSVTLLSMVGCPRSDSAEIKNCVEKKTKLKENSFVCHSISEIVCDDPTKTDGFNHQKLSAIFGAFFSCDRPTQSTSLYDVFKKISQGQRPKSTAGEAPKQEPGVAEYILKGLENSSKLVNLTDEQRDAYRDSIEEKRTEKAERRRQMKEEACPSCITGAETR